MFSKLKMSHKLMASCISSNFTDQWKDLSITIALDVHVYKAPENISHVFDLSFSAAFLLRDDRDPENTTYEHCNLGDPICCARIFINDRRR